VGVSSHCNLPILSLWDQLKAAGPLIYYKDRYWQQQKRRRQEIKKERVRKKERKQGRKKEQEKASKQDRETDKLNPKIEFAWAAIFLHARCHRIMASLRLEKTSKTMKSNCLYGSG